MVNHFLDRTEQSGKQSRAYHRSKKQERELSKKLGGNLTLASGSLSKKGDVFINRVVRIEAKTTSHKSFSVTLDMLEKLNNAALPCDEVPVIIIEFLDALGKPIGDVACVPSWAIEKLIHNAKANS